MTQTLYSQDFYIWTQHQAALLRDEEFSELDLNNLIEEIESMGRNQKKEVRSRARVLLTHLLKLSYQPNGRPTRGWRTTIRDQRLEIADETGSLSRMANRSLENIRGQRDCRHDRTVREV